MWVSAMCACLCRGRSMPAIRAIFNHSFAAALGQPCPGLALALFVLRILANHPHHSVARDDLALVTHFLNRCAYFHNSVSYLVTSPATLPRGLKPALPRPERHG